MKDPPSIVGRWLDYISQFNFTLEHVARKENIPANFLSRMKNVELDSDGESVVLGSVRQLGGSREECKTSVCGSRCRDFEGEELESRLGEREGSRVNPRWGESWRERRESEQMRREWECEAGEEDLEI